MKRPVGCRCTSVRSMRVDLLTREYPPEVYGGAGVHVAELVRRCGATSTSSCAASGCRATSPERTRYLVPPSSTAANPALATLGVDLQMAEDVAGADLVHSHTWYANGAGPLAKLLHGIPHVVTAHSLEPLRPWKAEQLGGGYRVSQLDRAHRVRSRRRGHRGERGDAARHPAQLPDVDPERVHVVHNGIDLERWCPIDDPDIVRGARRRPRPPHHRLRRPHHPAEGPAVPAARGARAAPGRAARALRRRARHRGDPRRGAGRRRTPCSTERDGRGLARPPAAASTSSPRCSPPRRPSCARRSTSRSASSTSRPWPAAHPSSARRPAASPRSSPTASPGVSCRSSRPTTARARRSTPSVSSPISPRRSPRSSPTRRGRAAMGEAGRRRAEARLQLGRASPPARGESTSACCSLSLRAAGAPPAIAWTIMASRFSNSRDLSVVRGGNRILDSLSWTVDSDQRWVILGPNGAGKTTLLQVASAQMHPSSGHRRAARRAPRQGRRVRAAPADRLRLHGDGTPHPARRDRPGCRDDRRLLGHGPLERGVRGASTAPRPARARRVAARAPRGPPFGTSQRRRAEARADRPLRHDRPRTAAARRAGGEPRPRCPRGAAAAARRVRGERRAPAIVMVTHHVEEIPPGFTHALLLADGGDPRGGPDRRGHSPPRSSPRRSACRSSSPSETADSPPAPPLTCIAVDSVESIAGPWATFFLRYGTLGRSPVDSNPPSDHQGSRHEVRDPPQLRAVVFRDLASGETFLTRSTATSDKTIELDGDDLPGDRRRDLVRLAPVLHGQAAHHGQRRPRREVQHALQGLRQVVPAARRAGDLGRPPFRRARGHRRVSAPARHPRS